MFKLNWFLEKILEKKDPITTTLLSLTALIILYFAVVGSNHLIQRLQPSYYAGEIFGKKISKHQYEVVLNHTRILGRLRFGEAYDQLEDFVNIEDQAWERLILLHEAQKAGLKVSDQEVSDTIADYDVFYRDGKFSMAIYRQIIRGTFQTEPKSFEESIRESLLVEKLFDHVTSSIKFSEEDLWTEYKRKKDQFKISYTFVLTEKFLDQVEVRPEEEQAYYEEHKKDFLKAPSVNIEYVKLHFPEEGGVQKEVETKFKARAIRDDFLKNPKLTLKEIAPKYQSDYTFDMEESGFFSKEEPFFTINWSFDDMKLAFKMDVNQVSEPIELEDGYLLFRIKEKRGSYIPERAEIQEQIQKDVRYEKAKKLARQKAEELLKQIEEQWKAATDPNVTFHQITEQLGLETRESPLFRLGQYLKEIGRSKDLDEAIFELNAEKRLSRVAEVPEGCVVAFLEERQDVEREKFEQEKSSFIPELISEKREEAYTEYVKALKEKADLKKGQTPNL